MISFYPAATSSVKAAAIYVNKDDWPAFVQLIQRGANLWPDAPPEIKAFADLVTTGHVQQDYEAQNQDQRVYTRNEK